MTNIDELINSLSENDKSIMTIIGRISGSNSKNFTRQTIFKKATNEEQKFVNDSLENLRKKGLIRYYRKPDNFAVNHDGFIVAMKLKEEFRENNYPFRILMII